jgi:hypothetical protein
MCELKGDHMSNKERDENPAAVDARIAARIKGATNELGTGDTVEVLGVTYDAVQLTAKLQTCQAPYTATDQAHHAFSEAVKARDTAQPGTLEFLDALDSAVEGKFGPRSPKVESFGISPRKAPRTLTPEQKLAKAEKSRLTRARLKAARANAPATPASGATTPPTK